jgi:hypothetical protein
MEQYSPINGFVRNEGTTFRALISFPIALPSKKKKKKKKKKNKLDRRTDAFKFTWSVAPRAHTVRRRRLLDPSAGKKNSGSGRGRRRLFEGKVWKEKVPACECVTCVSFIYFWLRLETTQSRHRLPNIHGLSSFR